MNEVAQAIAALSPDALAALETHGEYTLHLSQRGPLH